MDLSHPTTLGMVCHYMKRNPKELFRFGDKKAVITYYRPWHTLVYLLGDFAGDDPDDIVAELHRAAASSLN